MKLENNKEMSKRTRFSLGLRDSVMSIHIAHASKLKLVAVEQLRKDPDYEMKDIKFDLMVLENLPSSSFFGFPNLACKRIHLPSWHPGVCIWFKSLPANFIEFALINYFLILDTFYDPSFAHLNGI
jgi:hypothetical protein